jgi:glutamate racemase
MSILVFDSGIGGLGIVRAMRKLMPQAAITYLMDDAGFPYGMRTEADLLGRILRVMRAGINIVCPSLVVIGCNTASTVALAALRESYSVPFVGCVPPVRTAAALSKTGVFGVLATPATVGSPYLRALADRHAPECRMLVHGAAGLATLAEKRFAGEGVDIAAVTAELRGLVEQADADLIDVVALGCTHYGWLSPELQASLPDHVTWLDPATPVAQQAWRLSHGIRDDETVPGIDGLVMHTGSTLDVTGRNWADFGATRSARIELQEFVSSSDAKS